MRLILLAIFIFLFKNFAVSQGCCSGSGSNPIAGGTSTGVLQKYQMEISLNYQNNTSNTFFEGTEEVNQEGIYDKLSSEYLFLRTDYGISKKLTLSLATGYYLNKALKEKDTTTTLSNSGMGDLIIFPRYDIYNKTKGNIRTEASLGIGLKIPIGSHTDTVDFSRSNTIEYLPSTLQLSTGGKDIMLYAFYFREYKKQKFRLFANSLYIKKGYNSLDDKFGDYASLSLFASKIFFRKWGITTQIKGEQIGQLNAKKSKLERFENNTDDFLIDFEAGSWNDKKDNTGAKKVFFIPQISYSQNGITIFVTSEIPLYQYLVGNQIGSKKQCTFGVNYRFQIKECEPEFELEK